MNNEKQYRLIIAHTYDDSETSKRILTRFGEALKRFGYFIYSYENVLSDTVTFGPDFKSSEQLPPLFLYILTPSAFSSREEDLAAFFDVLQNRSRTNTIILLDKLVDFGLLKIDLQVIPWDENNSAEIAAIVNQTIKELSGRSDESTDNSPTLRIGSRGEQVAAIQQMLKKTVAPEMVADGVYGPSTAGAVKLFQKNNNLEITGEVDEQTFQRLEEEARKAEQPPAETTSENTTGPDNRQPAHWLLKLNPATWAIPDFVSGQEAWFHSHDLQSNKRSEYEFFQKIVPGDIVLGYATEPIEKVVCTFRVEQGLHITNLGEGIMLKIDRVLKPQLPGTAVERVLGTNAPLSITAPARLLAISSEQFIDILNTSIEGKEIAAEYLASAKFFIRDNIEPTLGVTDIAAEVAELIRNLRNNIADKGRMVGIFGNWGRGKTFLAGQVFKALENDPFIRVDFHAWKYQDTHASWAYLYEAIARKYFEKPKTVTSFIGKLWFDFRKRFRLNLMRRGSAPLVRLGFSVLFMLIAAIAALSFSGENDFYMKAFWMLLTTAGFADAARLLIRYVRENKIKERATEVFKQYYEKPSFKDLLGVQAEIQGELRNLLRSWVGDERSPDYNKQILLFVDDIDRCSEDRMVQIIDALRVMLDDEEISKRVIVVAAIDERVLRRAIKWKYKELLDADRSLADNAEWWNTTLQITSEYMDKLFIAGIKLGTLTKKERQDVFMGLSKGKVQLPVPAEQKTVNETTTGTQTKPEQQTPPVKTDDPPKKGLADQLYKDLRGGDPSFQPKPGTTPAATATVKPVPPPAPENYEYSAGEHSYMLQLVEQLQDATPRQIRIFYYRYLLARNLLTIGMRQNGAENTFDPRERNVLLGKLLVHYTNRHSNKELQNDRRELQSATTDFSKVSVKDLVTGHADALVMEILETLEMVIAY